MNKNWNDRADKDLFFTILSVKNIGVISGSEWTTIGNHMRTLGYGFTNEGCRQHFQGLRRAKDKSDPAGPASPADSPRKLDPTLNPITRRPGPGRGRPRKPVAPVTGATPPEGSDGLAGTVMSTSAVPVPIPGVPAVARGAPGLSGVPGPHQLGQIQGQPPLPVSQSMSIESQTPMPGDDDLAVDPSLDDVDVGDVDDASQHMAKRPRLDPNQDPSLEDEAVMHALAAHNNPNAVDHFTTDFTYGDA
ncbi:hypothetical protein B0T19DRAFT_253922 [Cercophora scortea]|uniref:Myb-like domain-containing protein n=1 Tax=Cercophora scortea TaxID=314031 RepID=A0AAE0IA80_9PEZI|nr:hypothetical protein B0T19DRAFT_253922 [Cercophora scortea]